MRWPLLPLTVIQLETNCGAASARNVGWAAATGELIAFLDSDDAWHPRKVEMQTQYLQAHPEVAACGHSHTVAPELQGQPDALPPSEVVNAVRVGRTEILLRNRFVTPSVMIRRTVEFRFEAGQRHMEDHLLWMRMVLSGLHVTRLDVSLVTLFKPEIGAGGLSGDVRKMQLADMRNYLALWHGELLSTASMVFFIAWSAIKFVRRLTLLALGRFESSAQP